MPLCLYKTLITQSNSNEHNKVSENDNDQKKEKLLLNKKGIKWERS